MKSRNVAKSRSVAVPSSKARGAVTDKSPRVARKGHTVADPTICDQCGAVFTRKSWRFDHRVTRELLAAAAWGLCPACTQGDGELAHGRILLKGAFVSENEVAIRRRIDNVESRATHTQPMRRVVSVEWAGDTLEVLTTSQKLAHRLVNELKKAFGGRATYAWSDRDGSLFATWTT
jgi:NMD protein affecting ribosome stability and mRNA decay